MNHPKAAMYCKFVSWALVVNTFIWASAAFAPIDVFGKFYLDFLTWPLGDGTPVWTRELRWMAGIGAGLLSAVASFYFFIVTPAVARGDRQVLNAVLIGAIAWFAIDSAASYANGFSMNVIFNIPTLALLIGPIVMMKKS